MSIPANAVTAVDQTIKDRLEPGPWLDEPDLMIWVDEKTGLPCAIARNSMGTLCGYVGFPFSIREKYELNVKEIRDVLMVHGGVTFTDEKTAYIPRFIGIAETLPLDEIPKIFFSEWDIYGFDTGHSMDAWPDHKEPLYKSMAVRGGIYKDINYVISEVEMMATQLKALIPAEESWEFLIKEPRRQIR